MNKTFLVFMAVLLLGINQIMAIEYTVIDLGTLGGNYSDAASINNNGQVAGVSYVDANQSNYHAFLYDGTEMNDLGTLEEGTYSLAYDINDSGQVVGYSRISGDAPNNYHAFLYDGTAMNDLGVVGGTFSEAHAVNNNGYIVGRSAINRYNRYHAFFYDGVNMIDIGTLGGARSEAFDINDSGQIVGYSDSASGGRAFLYENGGMNNLGTLGGNFSMAKAINNNGWVTGSSVTATDSSNAFLYDGLVMKNLGTLGISSEGWGINDLGHVVGRGKTLDYDLHAFIYDGESMIDLNELLPENSGWELTLAKDINNSGQIVGQGKIGGQTHAVLLTPVFDTIYVKVDIKPEVCPNPLNVNSKGALPVAVLGTDVFDVNDIDPNSLEILSVKPIRSSYEDVASPLTEESLPEDCLCTTEGPDGYLDLTLKFDTQMIVEAIGEVEDGDYVVLPLTGFLMDDTPIEGTDCIVIIKKGKQN